MKEQDKSPEIKPNLPVKEVKAIVIRMITELGKRIDETNKNAKGSPLGRKKSILDGSMNLHKRMKNTRNGNYIDKYT